MARMIAIGPERFTLPFGAAGFEMAEAGPAEFLDTLRELLADRSVGLVVCGESLLTEAAVPELEDLIETAAAAVLVVPDGPQPRRTGYELTRAVIERAAGVDLLSGTDSEQSSVIREQ